MLRVLGYLFLLALVAALLFSACVSACGVAVVSVAAEGETFTAPVPLMLPLAVLRFAPERLFDERWFDERHDDGTAYDREDWRQGWRRGGFTRLPPEAAVGLRAVSGLLDSLEGVEDARLVEVRDGESRVSVAVEDGELVVLVRDGVRNARADDDPNDGDTVEVRVPLEALREAADACREDGALVECDARRLASRFLRAARGSEVRIEAEDARVGITVW